MQRSARGYLTMVSDHVQVTALLFIGRVESLYIDHWNGCIKSESNDNMNNDTEQKRSSVGLISNY